MNASDEANKQRFRNIIDKWKNTCIPAASAAYTLMTPQEWLALDTSRPTWEVICERPRSVLGIDSSSCMCSNLCEL